MPLIEVDWDKFEFRCHYFGQLMSKKRGKDNLELYTDAKMAHDKQYEKLIGMNDGVMKDKAMIKMIDLEEEVNRLKPLKDIPSLSNTCIKKLTQIYTEQTTGRKKDVESMYIDKGLMTEEDSITLYSLRYGKMYRKNKERISNGFVSGEIDFDDEEEDTVIDTKSTWDIFTFDEKMTIGLSSDYEWQGHMYMWLKNRKNFRLAYCLNNTPEELIQNLIKRLKYNFVGTEDDYQEAVIELRKNHTYEDLPDYRKIRVFDLKRNDEKIDRAKSMIPHFRNYLKNIKSLKIEENGY